MPFLILAFALIIVGAIGLQVDLYGQPYSFTMAFQYGSWYWWACITAGFFIGLFCKAFTDIRR